MSAAATSAPLSVAQEALWYLSRLAPGRLDYNESIQIHKDGPLDASALRRALGEMMRRHEAWRTVFDTQGGGPVQVVRPVPTLALPLLDLSRLGFQAAERQAAGVTGSLARIPYDLRHGPLLRPYLFRFPGEHHRLYLCMHHIVFDGVCLSQVVLPELVSLYEAYRQGMPSPLSDPPARYADFARWEQDWIAGPRAARRLQYWHERLAGYEALELPCDRPRPESRTGRGETLPVHVPAPVVRQLRDLAQAAGASLFQTLAAAWALVLRAYSGRQDVVFSTAADLRRRREFERIVGYCVTPLVLRVDTSGDPPFAELVVRVRNELLDGFGNLVPFERVVRELDRGRVGNANPVYGTMIVLEPAYQTPDPSWSLQELAGDAGGSSKLDLELQLGERPKGHIQGRLIYDADLFERATAERIAAYWLSLVQAAAEDPQAPVSQLAGVARSVSQPDLVSWNETGAEFEHAGLRELAADLLHRHADRPALLEDGAPQAYRELEAKADALAERLLKSGARPGEVVAVPGAPSTETVVGVLAAVAAGASYLALDSVHEPARGLPAADDPRGVQEPDRACALTPRVRPEGPPLLVPVPQPAVGELAQALAAQLALGPGDTVLAAPETWTGTLALPLWAPLSAGARLLLAPAGVWQDGSALTRLMRQEDVTLVIATPTTWRRLVDTGLGARRGLRALSLGEPLSAELAAAIQARCQVLWNAFACAETGGAATLAVLEDGGPVRLGRPLPGVRAYVVARHGEPVPLGAEGELLLAGRAVCGHYLGEDGVYAERFVAAPDGSGPAYRTGRRARWGADGELVLVPPRAAGVTSPGS